MECVAVVEMFQRSEEQNGVKYEYYVGDGDSKTYTSIQKSKLYNDLEVKKKESIEHVQKCMGERLRELVADSTKSKLSTHDSNETQTKRESLDGPGKLTEKLIDELTVSYGGAIRNNTNSVHNMKRAIWASYYHKISTDEEPQHSFCPSGRDSWCDWQRAVAEGSLANYKHKPYLRLFKEQVDLLFLRN